MKKVFVAVVLVLSALVYLYACGGGGGSVRSSSGNVVLSATDDISTNKQVTATITKVQLINPGAAGSTCDVLITPATLDIANLSSIIQLLNIRTCPVDFYSRLHLEFDKEVTLMDENNTTAACSFTSFKDELNNANALTCEGNTCSLDIAVTYRVFANINNELALDFDLSEFEVDKFPTSSCTVTMKVSPLSSSEIDLKKRTGYKDGMSGAVFDLATGTNTFRIAKGDKTFVVNYSQVSEQNIDQILQFAVSENLPVNVEASNFNVEAGNFSASAIFLKASGIVSNLNTSTRTFTLTYQTGKTITVDFRDAQINNRVEGQLSNGVSVQNKLNGLDNNVYSAFQVEVTDRVTED